MRYIIHFNSENFSHLLILLSVFIISTEKYSRGRWREVGGKERDREKVEASVGCTDTNDFWPLPDKQPDFQSSVFLSSISPIVSGVLLHTIIWVELVFTAILPLFASPHLSSFICPSRCSFNPFFSRSSNFLHFFLLVSLLMSSFLSSLFLLSSLYLFSLYFMFIFFTFLISSFFFFFFHSSIVISCSLVSLKFPFPSFPFIHLVLSPFHPSPLLSSLLFFFYYLPLQSFLISRLLFSNFHIVPFHSSCFPLLSCSFFFTYIFLNTIHSSFSTHLAPPKNTTRPHLLHPPSLPLYPSPHPSLCVQRVSAASSYSRPSCWPPSHAVAQTLMWCDSSLII